MYTTIIIQCTVFFVLLFLCSLLETALASANRFSLIRRLKGRWDEKSRIINHVENLFINRGGVILTLSCLAIFSSTSISSLLTGFCIEKLNLADDGTRLIFVSLIMTVFMVVFAELLPKAYALLHPETVILIFAPLFHAIQTFGSYFRFLAKPYSIIAKLFGFKKLVKKLSAAKQEEVFDVVKEALDYRGDVSTSSAALELQMLRSIVQLRDVQIAEIMTHKLKVEFVDIDFGPEVIKKEIYSSVHSRIMVCKGGFDCILGTISTKDYMHILTEDEDGRSVSINKILQLCVPPWYLPSTASIVSQLPRLRDNAVKMGIVLDEYGAFCGVVTLTDVFEDIIGSFDKKSCDPPWIEIGRGEYLVDGNVSVRDLNRELEWDIPDDDCVTVYGAVFSMRGVAPEIGDSVLIKKYRFKVLSSDVNGNHRLIVRKEQ